MRSSRWKLVATFLLMEILGMGRIVLAGPDKQLVVLNASVNRTAETLTLKGQNFGSTAPAVYCETTPMTVLGASDTQLVILFPSAMADGTYLITVARGNGKPESGVFYVTVQTTTTMQGPEGVAGPAGPRGDQGPEGPAGPAGPAWPAGSKGDTGATGASGPKGDTGAQGVAGPAGAAGPQGSAGPQGNPGAQGATGPAGAMGPSGSMGPAGPSGVSGYEYIVAPNPLFSAAPQVAVAAQIAACSPGRVPLGGGFELVGPGVQLTVLASEPFTGSTSGWRVFVRNNTSAMVSNAQVKVHVVCGVMQ